VLFVLSLLSAMALSSYVNSTDELNFISSFKELHANLRKARSFAITNKQINGQVPHAYGVAITSNRLYLFADVGDLDFVFEADPADPKASIVPPNRFVGTADAPPYDVVLDSTFYDTTNEYSITVALNLPVLIFYESGTGDLLVLENASDVVDKNLHKFIALRLCEFGCSANSLMRYVVLFQVSGLPEEFIDISSL